MEERAGSQWKRGLSDEMLWKVTSLFCKRSFLGSFDRLALFIVEGDKLVFVGPGILMVNARVRRCEEKTLEQSHVDEVNGSRSLRV
ncbi:unnamed protein product, partial [Onchocerca ochengi]|uniref:Uncharacterized protein n=1 Tax=Onchocerca ochengi TaxID=42157 RepID=A0A182ERB8_ONCOC